MDKLFYWFPIVGLLFLGACKKDNNFVADNTVYLNVINGIVQKDVLLKMNARINNSGANATNTRQNRVSFGANLLFYAEAKNTFIDFLNRTDSISLISKYFDLKKGGIYTVLLAGVAPNADAVLIDDSNLPYVNLSKTPTDADSVINIRFVNLSPNGPAVKVNIQGSIASEVTSLSYKGVSGFKTYAAKVANASYKFEFRDVVTDTLLFKTGPISLAVTTANRFKNVALVLRGLRGGSPALAVSAVNYFQ